VKYIDQIDNKLLKYKNLIKVNDYMQRP